MSWFKDTIKHLSGYDQIEEHKSMQMSEQSIKRQLINNMVYDIRMRRFNLDLVEDFTHNEKVIEDFLLDYAKRNKL